MGATLEIQRSQQMDALERQLMRQQARQFGGGARQRRAQVGQGFAERLVDDDGLGGAGGWGAFQAPNNFPPGNRQMPQEAAQGTFGIEVIFLKNMLDNSIFV